MADSQGQNYYWQSDNQNTTGENVGAVLDDLCDMIIITEIQNNQNTVTFVPGLNGERGHFRLGVGSKPINADKYTILTATGSPDNYAEGNEVEVLLKEGETYGNESCALFISDEVNGFRFNGSDGEGGGTDFIIANNAVVEIGNKPVEPWEEGVMEMASFNDVEIFNPTFKLENAAQFIMGKRDGTQTPYFQMLGDVFVDFQYNSPSNYYTSIPTDLGCPTTRSGVRSINPFYYEKDNPGGGYPPRIRYLTEAPLFQFHDTSTLQMVENSLLQIKNNVQAVMQGNANVHISGGAWSDTYHARLNNIFIISLYHIKNNVTTFGTITITLENVAKIPNDFWTYKTSIENLTGRYNISYLLNIVDPTNTADRIEGVTVVYDGITREQACEGSYITIDSASWQGIPTTPGSTIYKPTISDPDKNTSIVIAPGTGIRTNNTTDNEHINLISMDQTLFKFGCAKKTASYDGNGEMEFSLNGIMGACYAPSNCDNNYGFLIKKPAVHYPDANYNNIHDHWTKDHKTPYFSQGGAAHNIYMTGYAGSIINDWDADGQIVVSKNAGSGGLLTTRQSANYGASYAKIEEVMNGTAAYYFGSTGDTSISMNYHGTTAINIAPEKVFGVNITPEKTDIECKWDKFQGIFEGNDSFMQIDGNTHFESWSGTFILRASAPFYDSLPTGTHYPLFQNTTSGGRDVKYTITVDGDYTSASSQTIINTFGNQLIAPPPGDIDGFMTIDTTTASLDQYSFTKEKVNEQCKEIVPISLVTGQTSSRSACQLKIKTQSDLPQTTALFSEQEVQDILLEMFGTTSYTSSGTIGRSSSGGWYTYTISNFVAGLPTRLVVATSGSKEHFNSYKCPVGTIINNLKGHYLNSSELSDLIQAFKPKDAYNASGTRIGWRNNSYGGEVNSNDKGTKFKIASGYTSTVTCQTKITSKTTYQYKTNPQHLGKDWSQIIQTADRVGSSQWDKAPIIQMYGPVNFLMREKKTSQVEHETIISSTTTYDLSNMTQAIRDFWNNPTDVAAFKAAVFYDSDPHKYYVTEIQAGLTADTYIIVWYEYDTPEIASYTDTPVVEITDGSELRLKDGVCIRATADQETDGYKTVITISNSETGETPVSFTLDELRMLKALIGSVRTAVVNDPSEAVELGTLYFIDEGGNA